MERRSTPNTASIETRADGQKFISGYALVFYRDGDASTEYELWNDDYGRAVERITPEFARSAIEKSNDIIGVFNHDPANLLGRRSSGTLDLTIDERGLKYSIPYDETDPDHQRLAPKYKRGDLKGSSFMFRASEKWEGPPTNEVRWLVGGDDSEIHDVGPVTNPAYAGTTSGMRDVTPELADIRKSRLAARVCDQRQQLDIRRRMLEMDLAK